MHDKKYDVNEIAKLITENPDVFVDKHGQTNEEDSPANSGSTTAPTAPPSTKPITKPITKPNTPPKESPKKSPFGNPAPLVEPAPKAIVISGLFNEAYREFAHPRTREMWEKGHPDVSFTEHDMVKQHGTKLGEAGYNYSNEILYKTFPELRDLPANQRKQRLASLTMNALHRMMQLESPIKKQLEKIAVKAVSKLYGFPENQLKAFLKKPGSDDAADAEEDTEQVQMTPELKAQVDKRHMMNLMSQGAAIHNMHNAHFEEEVMAAVQKLSPELHQLYSAFGRGASHHYWIYDLNMMLGASINAAMGVAKVKGNDVIAEAAVFPVLLQELVKGVMTFISQHQFTDMDLNEARKIIKLADTLANEFPQIQIGPKVWKELLSIIPAEYKPKLAYVVMHMASAHPKELHVIMMGLAKNIADGTASKGTTTEQALKELLERTMHEETEEAESEYQDSEDYQEDDLGDYDGTDGADDEDGEDDESWR